MSIEIDGRTQLSSPLAEEATTAPTAPKGVPTWVWWAGAAGALAIFFRPSRPAQGFYPPR